MPRLYGLTEIAQALGVSRQAVRNWLTRGRIPPPTQHIAAGPVWVAEDIEPWIDERRGT